jgi:hypothetical protein
MNGTRDSSQMHMVGLMRMVALRGGLTSFKHTPVLQRLLTWFVPLLSATKANTARSDILYSSTWHVKSRFPFLPRVEDNDDPISNLSRFASTLDSYSVTLNRNWFPSNPTLLAVIETMRRISGALSSPDLGRPDRVAISYRIYLIEHHLTSFRDKNPSSPDSNSNVSTATVDLSPAFRLAALLYLRISVRELPPAAKMHLHLVHRIRLIFESESSIIDSCACNQSLELLAWISFIAGAATSNSNDRQYFVGLLVAVCRVLGVQLKAQLHARLVGVCWREGVCEECSGELWNEIELLRLDDMQIRE